MARPASESLHALLAFHGVAAADLTDADLERVVGGKALRREKPSTSESQKAPRTGDNSPDAKLDKFFERQSQNSNSNRN